MSTKKPINRIRVVLAEQDRTNKWLAEKVGKSRTTVSRWCTNEMQPSLETLRVIAEALGVDIRELLVATTGNKFKDT
ncbi:helix-turn-helix domain-containing protein [Muricauda oceani]|uniref:Helix-turn-helix transcriptional regulator n=1 Tax=Flagellimonas oceani TaxID=2698672 RepID=A0A6G7J1Q2_9FLAO|nr:helix-turn-helix transcriptional regulator [Allomuricauda oceani]MBW8241455.1 helix-turn-helix domain-containing protein [Allomuricauda oceani]QII44549.1 helix-turn-helix transcriptional regulator [Allomuricauda oceani]